MTFHKGNKAGRALRLIPVAMLISAGLATGCAKRDSIVVGSVPDDYRTNHPIVVAEKEEVIDIPVGRSDFRASKTQRIAMAGFLDGYDRDSSSLVLIMVPAGSANEAAASSVAHELAELAHAHGVGRGNIALQTYGANDPAASAPIRVTYSAMRASTGPCGRWPADVLDTAENKHYANFGCAYQNNLAAQIAEPADLLGPRKMTEIDPENRDNAIRQYKARGVAPEFNSNSEVFY